MGHLWKIMLWYMKIFFLNIQIKDTWSFNKRYEDLIVLGEGSYERDVRAIHVTKALTLLVESKSELTSLCHQYQDPSEPS